jgi:DNA-binding NarL/FixJ family response regulator
MTPIRVVVADDDAGVREALVDVLSADRRFLVVGSAATGHLALVVASAVRPDVVLLDVRMPGGGPAAAHALSGLPGVGRSGAPLVIAVSADTDAGTVAAMLRAGAVGFLAKGRLGDLPDLVARCAGGEVVLAVPSAGDALREVMLPGVVRSGRAWPRGDGTGPARSRAAFPRPRPGPDG